MQATDVCYGAKGNNFGRFKLRQEGFLVGMKLEHVSGTVTCYARTNLRWSYWGCYLPTERTRLETVITDSNNLIIYPNSPTKWMFPRQYAYQLAGHEGRSKILVFSGNCSAVYARKGQQLRIWYGEDLTGVTESDNGGKHCVNVYAMFKD